MAEPGAILVTGAGGMLGSALAALLERERRPFVALDRVELDITDPTAVRAALERLGAPGTVVNCAAYTDVERAEGDADAAYAVNETGARIVAEAAARCGLGLVQTSTDFVFDGEKGAPYAEDDVPHPLSVYGASKLAGERAVQGAHSDVLLVRTSWVYGRGGANFPDKILARARAHEPLRVVTDEVGCPTYAADLAEGLMALIDAGASGAYHLAGTGWCSRWELARRTLDLAGVDVEVERVSRGAFATGAERPADSRLDCSKAAALGIALAPWEDALGRYVVGER